MSGNLSLHRRCFLKLVAVAVATGGATAPDTADTSALATLSGPERKEAKQGHGGIHKVHAQSYTPFTTVDDWEGT